MTNDHKEGDDDARPHAVSYNAVIIHGQKVERRGQQRLWNNF